jgi:ATP-dependent RNA helicase DeaD
VLDEVDRMLDIGFREDIRRILGMMRGEHQTIFVSATISEEIEKLARKFMKDPVRLETAGGSLTVSLVEQHYIPVRAWDKKRMLHHVLTHEKPDTTLVFCRMKRTVDDVARYLKGKGVDAHAIHGDMYQGRRNSVMKRMRAGELSVLIASDLAARGLDVEGITHVINYDLPDDPEIYIHRIGRTARAGREGMAWSFVTPEEGPLLTEIEKLANVHIAERPYAQFEPGPLPESIQAEKDRDEKRLARLQSRNRYADPNLPSTRDAEDRLRFPGGVVPAKMPDKRMRGRIKTARSMKLESDTDKKEET